MSSGCHLEGTADHTTTTAAPVTRTGRSPASTSLRPAGGHLYGLRSRSTQGQLLVASAVGS